jgi:mannose/fructose-specific phosphotransferase system component IIA
MNARDCCHDQRQIRIICGLNLPMLLEASAAVKTLPLADLYEHLLEVGKASIVGWQYPAGQEAVS